MLPAYSFSNDTKPTKIQVDATSISDVEMGVKDGNGGHSNIPGQEKETEKECQNKEHKMFHSDLDHHGHVHSVLLVKGIQTTLSVPICWNLALLCTVCSSDWKTELWERMN